jgi:hypothetical protein
MRTSIALEPKSRGDPSMPITGDADSRVSFFSGEPIVCRRRKRPKDDTDLVLGPRIGRVSVEIGEVHMPEGDMEQEGLQRVALFCR